MERKISFTDVQTAVDEAFEQFKSLKEGTVCSCVAETAKAGDFGISLMLADGRTVDKGDTQVQVALGPVAKVPVSVVLLSQNNPTGLAKKATDGCCKCSCGDKDKKAKLDLPFGKHGLRAVSALQPSGDPDSKFRLVSDMIYALSNANQGFDDSLYKMYASKAKEANAVEQIVEAGYRLYDDTEQTIDVYSRLLAVKLNTRELAAMGATIAADGRNPITGQYAFDGSIAANVVALMATRGKGYIKPWMMATGMPAKKSRTGVMLAVLPGFGAIAAYSPELNEMGVPVKAAMAIKYIANKLGLNVFASARVSVD